ncbi:MAG: HAMP domain-containing protein [Myxococcales bacterium]|nr:HAMP domain-containing protein [Myxococcales bacterium]
MRSLQVKFSTLVVTVLVVACVGLAYVATQHERRALESAVERHGRALAQNLAEDAKEPLLNRNELSLGTLVRHSGEEEGLVAARLLDLDGRVVASLAEEERGQEQARLTMAEGSETPRPSAERRGERLVIATPVEFSDTVVGEAQLELDLNVLVEPVVRETRAQLTTLAVAVILLGVGCGIAFVTLLVGPLRRLTAGVEQLTEGNLATRIPPTSRDEVGELTRAFNKMGESLQQKERIQSAFGRYVSNYVLDQLLESSDDELHGTEREVTILFCDIRQFTRLSEGMKAADVVALLNEVFQLATDCILEQGGTIDKFIGDSVMAYFGAPVPSSDHALQATRAAVEIERAVAARNVGLGGGGTPVEMGIGIHTGTVIVGTIGSDRRTDFTAIGDPVNVAHRLEKLARPGEILVSEAVQRRVRGEQKLHFEGERQLSGRLEPVHVYSVEYPGYRARTSGDTPGSD